VNHSIGSHYTLQLKGEELSDSFKESDV